MFKQYSDDYDTADRQFNKNLSMLQNKLLSAKAIAPKTEKLKILNIVNELRKKLFSQKITEEDTDEKVKQLKNDFFLATKTIYPKPNEEVTSLLNEIIENKIEKDKNIKLILKKRKELKDITLPKLRNKIKDNNKNFDLSDETAWEILRRENIKYSKNILSKKKHFEAEYRISDLNGAESTFTYVAEQVPLSDYSIYPCYRRWVPTEGSQCEVAGLRKHTLTAKNNNLLTIKQEDELTSIYELWLHSSTPAKQILDFKQRMDSTIQETKNLSEKLGGVLTEIRLLSPAQKVDGKQIFETFVAGIISEKDVTLFVYGVNFLKHMHGIKNTGTQTCINTMSTNQLLEKLFERKFSDDVKLKSRLASVLNNIKIQRTKFFIYVQNLYKTSPNEQEFKEKVKAYMKDHHKLEEHNLKIYETFWNKHKDKLQDNDDDEKNTTADIDLLFRLRNGLLPKFNEEEYHGQIQAVLFRLNRKLERNVAIGCDDAKDRATAIGIVIEASELFKEQYKRYPFTIKEKIGVDRELMNDLERQVYEKSIFTKTAEWISQPYLAKRLDNIGYPTSKIHIGYQNFFNEYRLAGSFKHIYGDPPVPLTSAKELVKYAVDRLMATKNNEELKNEIELLRNDDTFKDLEGELLRYFDTGFENNYKFLQNYGNGLGKSEVPNTQNSTVSNTSSFSKEGDKTDNNLSTAQDTGNNFSNNDQNLDKQSDTKTKLQNLEFVKNEFKPLHGKQRTLEAYVVKAQDLRNVFIDSNLTEGNKQLKKSMNCLKQDREFGWRVFSNIFKGFFFPVAMVTSYLETGSCRFWKVKGERVTDTNKEKFLESFGPKIK